MASDRYIFEIIEQAIIESGYIEYYPYNNRLDFKVDDIVQCSYIHGIFKVTSVNKTYLTLECLNKFKETKFLVGKPFLKKIEVDSKTLEVLYDVKRR